MGMEATNEVKVAMAERTGKGSKKEEGCTPMLMRSHPLAKKGGKGGARGCGKSARGGGKSWREVVSSTRGGGE